MKTTAAKAAAAIRKELKANYPDLKFTCRSDNFAGGNAVRLSYENQAPDVHASIQKMLAKYQYGHFDGMIDLYEHSNVREDIPQVKYLQIKNEMSPLKKQGIWNKVRVFWAGGDDLPEDYDEARNMRLQNEWVSDRVWRAFTGADKVPGVWS